MAAAHRVEGHKNYPENVQVQSDSSFKNRVGVSNKVSRVIRRNYVDIAFLKLDEPLECSTILKLFRLCGVKKDLGEKSTSVAEVK